MLSGKNANESEDGLGFSSTKVGGGEEGRWSKLGVMCKMAGTKMCKMGAQP